MRVAGIRASGASVPPESTSCGQLITERVHQRRFAGERDGIPATLLAFMRGHAVKSVTEGRLGYSGNRRGESGLDDQEARWPNGPGGVVGAPGVLVSSNPPEAARLHAGFIGAGGGV